MKCSKDKLRKRITLEGKIKLLLAMGLVIYSIIVSSITGVLALLGMLMSFGGDVFLMKRKDCFHNKEKDDLKLGILLFMLAHIFYAIIMDTPINHYIISGMAVICIFYLMLIVFGAKENLSMFLYAIVLILSVVNTFFFNQLAFIGGCIFLISDSLILLFKVIKNDGLIRHVSIWGTYVAAQILILTSFLI